MASALSCEAGQCHTVVGAAAGSSIEGEAAALMGLANAPEAACRRLSHAPDQISG